MAPRANLPRISRPVRSVRRCSTRARRAACRGPRRNAGLRNPEKIEPGSSSTPSASCVRRRPASSPSLLAFRVAGLKRSREMATRSCNAGARAWFLRGIKSTLPRYLHIRARSSPSDPAEWTTSSDRMRHRCGVRPHPSSPSTRRRCERVQPLSRARMAFLAPPVSSRCSRVRELPTMPRLAIAGGRERVVARQDHSRRRRRSLSRAARRTPPLCKAGR